MSVLAPFIANLALKVETIFTEDKELGVPKILRQLNPISNEFSRLQVAVLLANMFFGTV